MLLTKFIINKNVKLDFFHLEEQSSDNVNVFNTTKYVPVLNNYSRFLVSFDDGTTLSKGVSDVALGYTFSVYKEIKDTNDLVYIAKLNNGELSITDYGVTNDNTYKYYIFKEDDSAISEAVVSNDVNTCWWDWSIIDVVPSVDNDDLYYAVGDIWKFNLNVSSSSKTQNMNTTIYNNFTRFPKVSVGELNYSSGTLTCLLGNVQKSQSGVVEYVEPSSMLEEWNEFCVNGNIKLLKDRKGNAMLVVITSTSSQTDDVTREQSNTITFNWIEVDNIKNIAVIGAQ